MTAARMHEGETPVTLVQAASLVAAQFPQWAELPMTDAREAGTDNRLIRLGKDMVMRFPRTQGAAAQVMAEARWLPRIAPHLPLQVPVPLAQGQPGHGYPHSWQILRWIAGTNALTAPPSDDLAAARALAEVVSALRGIPVPADAPAMPVGGRLHPRDAFTRQMIALIKDEADPSMVMRLWQEALAMPVWQGPPVLIHADLHPLNLLTQDGRIAAVIDWGAFCAGDPAHDLICGWTVLGPAGRAQFRSLLAVDDTTWARGRALAFSKAVMAAPYYRDSNPILHGMMRRTLTRTMADWLR